MKQRVAMKDEQFKVLSPRDHVRLRTNMYLGSTSLETVERFVLGKWKKVSYIPAFNKMIDEIIDNSIDEAIRTKFKFANQIDVKVSGNNIHVSDNGRGIPQEDVIDSAGNTISRPEAAWTRTNAGTSFEDDRTTIGANGVGSACANFMSKQFVGDTWRDKKRIIVTCTDGANETNVFKGTGAEGSGTSVRFTPDTSLFDGDFYEADTETLVHDRLTSLQVAFPEIKFKFNGKRINENNIKKYANLFTIDASDDIVVSNGDSTNCFFTTSSDGFRTTSYVNGVNTRLGGSYVDYVVGGVAEHLGILIKRKHKIEVNKSTIKSGLTFVLFARDFKDPKYDSQTKERLTNGVADVKAHYDGIDFEKIARKVLASEGIVGPIVEAQLAKKIAAERRAATLAQKKLKKVKVAKHIAATTSDSTLFLCEGDSAIGFLLKVRDPKRVGGYPLRGVIMNVWDMKPADVLKSKELSELVAVLGLDINDPDSIDDMAYQNIASFCDADVDGGHINALLLAFFHKFWPRLFTDKRVHIARTPIMISEKGKDVKWFYNGKDAQAFKASTEGYHHRYIKGLASHTEEEYYKLINEPKLDTISVDDPHWFEVFFGKDAKLRKEWLN